MAFTFSRLVALRLRQLLKPEGFEVLDRPVDGEEECDVAVRRDGWCFMQTIGARPMIRKSDDEIRAEVEQAANDIVSMVRAAWGRRLRRAG